MSNDRSPAPASRPKDLRLEAFERMQSAYDAYHDIPQRKTTAFRALRALVHLCRLHGMTGDQAALLAELGRADEDTGAGWQLILKPRSSRAIQEREARERERDASAATFSRQSGRFAAVLGRIDLGETLHEACEAVGSAERPSVGWETVAADFRELARPYRDAGIFAVPYVTAGRVVPLPRSGRPRKII